MGMSLHLVGFRPADEQWSNMKAIWFACKSAGIKPPPEVVAFFDDEDPGDKPGQYVSIGAAAKKWNDDSRDGYELDVKALPNGVQFVRFYCSW